MRCQPITREKRMCNQERCVLQATCVTRISGFIVRACKKHHVCDLNGGSEFPKQAPGNEPPDIFDCPCPRCLGHKEKCQEDR